MFLGRNVTVWLSEIIPSRVHQDVMVFKWHQFDAI